MSLQIIIICALPKNGRRNAKLVFFFWKNAILLSKKKEKSNIYEIPCAPQNFPITAVSFVSAAKLLVPSKMVKTSCAHSVPFLPCSKKNDDISILIKMLVFCAQGHLMYYGW